MTNLYFYDASAVQTVDTTPTTSYFPATALSPAQTIPYPPTEDQLALFPASYAERYRTSKSEQVRQQAVGSAVLLGVHLGVTSDDQLVVGEHGKLSLAQASGLTLSQAPDQQPTPRYFCLSHSGSVTVLAVSDEPVGVDLEHVRDLPGAIVDRFYPPSFQEELAAVPDEERDETFCRLWTRLEAALKLDGRGLTAPRGDFDSIVAQYNIVTERDGDLFWSIATEK